jgi:plasmid stability protein
MEGERLDKARQTTLLRTSLISSHPIFAIMIAVEAAMAQILVRNLEDRLKGRLQRRAKQNGRSMEAEAREILRNALKGENAPAVGFGTASVALFSGQGIGLKEGEEIHEWRGFPLKPISFDE